MLIYILETFSKAFLPVKKKKKKKMRKHLVFGCLFRMDILRTLTTVNSSPTW